MSIIQYLSVLELNIVCNSTAFLEDNLKHLKDACYSVTLKYFLSFFLLLNELLPVLLGSGDCSLTSAVSPAKNELTSKHYKILLSLYKLHGPVCKIFQQMLQIHPSPFNAITTINNNDNNVIILIIRKL